MVLFLTLYLAIACGIWSALYLYAALMWHKVPQFANLITHPPRQWPRVSLIITACNEADTIGTALQSMQAQRYQDLEIIVVNDRSEDATAGIVSEYAARDPRIKLLDITHLPEDWLGKVHALQRGADLATGDWLLFADADIHFQANVIEQAIAYAEAEQLDHLALIPHTRTDSVWLKATMNVFGLLFLVTMRAQSVANPRSQAAVGVGAFNLVRRSLFNKTPGFAWLRMEVADDVGLAHMLKQHGAKTRFAIADKALAVTWYPNLPAMARGLEKNLVGPTTRYNTTRFYLNAALLLMLVCAPVLALLSWQLPFMCFGLGVLASLLLLTLRIPHEDAQNRLAWLLSPVGFWLICLIYIRAGLLLIWRDGIIWRGTLYRREALKHYQRVRL